MAGSDRDRRELWRMAGMGMEFASSTLGLGAVGWGLDYLWGTLPWFTVGGVLAGVVMSTALMFRQAMAANRRASRSFDHREPPDRSTPPRQDTPPDPEPGNRS